MKGLARVAMLIGGGLALIVACGGSTDEAPASSGSSTSSSSSASSSGIDSGPYVPSGSSTSSTSGSISYYPPGCMDGPPRPTLVFRVDDSHFRVVGADVDAATACSGTMTRPANCWFTYFEMVLTVPSGTKSGTWTLPSPDVTLVRTKYFPRVVSGNGCACTPEDLTQVAVEHGKIHLDLETDAGAGPSYVGRISFDDVTLVNEGGGGTIERPIARCP